MSFGGVLGGAFNAFAAPLLFDAILEYPLMLALAGLLRPTLAEGRRSRLWDLALPAVLGAALIPKADVAAGGLGAIVLYTQAPGLLAYSLDRSRGVPGTSVSGRVDVGCRRIMNKKDTKK